MKLTIFGATGGTGQELVKQALADGHEVTAFVRTPSKMTTVHDNLHVKQGELNQHEKLAEAIAGADAVLSTLGPTSNKPEKVVTKGMEGIIAGMKRHGITRLIATTGAGVPDPHDEPKLINHIISFALKLMARHVLADSLSMVEAIRQSDLDWTIARAPRLTDNPATGQIKAGYVGQGLGTQLTRADYARFMLDQLNDDNWVRKAPALSS
jgi:putative NADH-flavin reductase